MKTLFCSLLITLFSVTLKSQTTTMHKLISIGYTYQNNNFAEVGGKLLFLKKDQAIFRVGVSALMGSVNKKFAVLPKAQGDFLFSFEDDWKRDFNHSYYFVLGADLTTQYFAPKAGFSLFGIADLTGGYGFSLDKKGVNGKDLKGANINFTINLPIPLIYDLTH